MDLDNIQINTLEDLNKIVQDAINTVTFTKTDKNGNKSTLKMDVDEWEAVDKFMSWLTEGMEKPE